MIEQIGARIAELERELDRYVVQANTQIAAYQAAIGELKRLIEPVQTEYIESTTVESQSQAG